MNQNTVIDLLVIGAGPKAAALAAKNAALQAVGIKAPTIHFIEQSEIGAHWTGNYGFTDGEQKLQSPAQQDLSFPRSNFWTKAEQINKEIEKFSWSRFLSQHSGYENLGDCDQSFPTHLLWSKYLKWSMECAKANVTYARVEEIDCEPDQKLWLIRANDRGTIIYLQARAIVITGTGKPKLISKEASPRIMDASSFWAEETTLRLADALDIGVVGTGESAASIVSNLIPRVQTGARVSIISSCGVLYSRGDSPTYTEFYTNSPEAMRHWKLMSLSHRREFMNRTDHNVFSPATLQSIYEAGNIVQVIPGRVRHLLAQAERVRALIDYDGNLSERLFDLVIQAVGFNRLWFTELLSARAIQSLNTALNCVPNASNLEESLNKHLAVANLHPALHLPMLSGLHYGPGLPNLNCLGSLSDRILSGYIQGEFGDRDF